MDTKKTLIVCALIIGSILAWGKAVNALKPPHDGSKSIACSTCHFPRAKFRTLTSTDTLCYNATYGCHRSDATGESSAAKKKLSWLDASNRFGSLPPLAGRKQSSHGWKIPNDKPDAGATNWNPGQPYKVLNERIFCSRCHMAHGEVPQKKFLNASPLGDYICLKCHTKRDIDSVRSDKQSDVISGSKHYSHPVQVNYSTARGDKPGFYETTPQLAPGYNESARPKLYTTFNFDSLGRPTGVKGQNQVICSTCHGPIHSADSNPYTFDNLSTYSKAQTNYSSSDGNLLRQYPIAGSKASNNLCLSCHKVKTHQGNSCGTCHEPHKKAGDTNIYLIKKVIATPYGNHSVFFTSTTQMAKRYGIYSGSAATNYRERSNAICQVCHRTKSHHRAYSTTGADRVHNVTRNCTACHPHNATADGFRLEGGCAGCHGQPPDDTFGKHGKHTNDSASHSWKDGKNSDARSAGSYGFSCGRCHNPWTPYTATVENYKGPRHYTDFGSYKTYTADIGFANGTPLPANDTSKAGYNFGARGSVDNGASPTDNFGFNTPQSGVGTCRNIYCHGQFFNGYTANDPVWNANNNQPCGKCHGVAPELGKGIPGNTGGTNWGAHPRHVGSASQQYGTSGNFRCNACHVASATQNAISTVGLDRRYHVNGRINVQFDAAYGYGGTKYGSLNNYSAALSTTAIATKTAYKTCELTYCHSDGSRLLGNYSASNHSLAIKYPNWSSVRNFTTTVAGTKRRCARCHGSAQTGLTSSMPGYGPGFRADGKGNSHLKHIQNGFFCIACHSQTVGTDNKSIAGTTKHLNKVYDVNFQSKYDAGGAVYNGDKTCSNVKCHGGRRTPSWGTTGRCQDCHYKSTAEVTADEGYADNYAWKSMTSTASVPRIYSGEWSGKGHGASGGKLPKVCTDCHKASGTASHSSSMTNNPFRLYTAASHVDDLCQACHGTGGARSTEADKKVISHTAAAVGGDATWAFTPKCIDCHDPHGDKNRAMIQKYINYSGSDPTTGKRTYDISNSSGYMTFSTVGGGLINWSSFVKSDFTGICQRCHNTQSNMKHFRKYSTSTGDGYNVKHNPGNRCINCHTHDTGFKPKDCGGCHYYPPVLSGKHSFHVATTVTKVYVGYEVNNTNTKYAYGCGKCHDSGDHYAGAGGNYTTEVAFDTDNSYPRNSGTYVFGAKSSIDQGADGAGGFSWVSTKGTCQNLYCHGEFAGGNTANDPLWYGTSVCGNCHGASQASAPTGGAHGKHVGTLGYDCRNCHDDTVDAGVTNPNLKDRRVHVDGKTQWKLYTAWSARIGGAATYYGSRFGRVTTETSSPTYGYCQNLYCHSRGTDITNPYNDAASLPNYTAKWSEGGLTGEKKCAYCHGNKTYKGITAAMPFQTGQAHKVHVVDNNFTKCYICHSNVVDSNNNIVSTTNHVNQFKNISVIKTYKSGSENYSGQKCSNIRCHGGRLTPAWTATATCKDCHYSTSDTADYQFRNYSVDASIARIYSSQWADKGHGRSGTNYPQSGNAAAGKNCTNCHSTSVKHNTASNPFRLFTSDPDQLCAACHGSGTGELGKWSQTFGVRTGIKTHRQSLVNDGANQGNAAWDFGQHFDADQKRAKCVDCHDPHGDANRYMVSSQVNYTGTNKYGVPAQVPSGQMLFSTIGGQWRWSSYVKSDYSQICQRCHSGGDTNMANFSKNDYNTGHNAGTRCVTCHTHKSGFKGGGCYGCHGTQASNGAPPDSPSAWTSDKASNWTTVGLHEPHGYNPRSRYINGSAGGTYSCAKCHGPETDGRSETGHPGNTDYAGMRNLTSTATSSSERANFSTGGTTGKSKVVDDTCWNTGCHTPRAYTRKWGKPRDCDDCHGYRKGVGAAQRAFNLQTTGAHKMHINWTGVANPPASWKKNYNFACTKCHYNAGNNYTTHYSGQVNFTTTTPNIGGQYSRGWAFKGFTTGGEYGTCQNIYCHGEFLNGGPNADGNAGVPNWKKGVTPMNCSSCHKGKADAATMPERHPKHANDYGFRCSGCHVRTVQSNYTVIFNYSSHVNFRKDTYFSRYTALDGTMKLTVDNTGATFQTGRKCLNAYCHSKGSDFAAPFNTRTSFSVYTADWDDTPVSYKTTTGSRAKCNYCHGNKVYLGITSAMPYNSKKADSHSKHVVSGGYVCSICHYGVARNNTSISDRSRHANRFYNISFAPGYRGAAGKTYSTTWNPAVGGTCMNTSTGCHGSGKPKWGDPSSATCRSCHMRTSSGDADDYGTVNSTAAQIYSTEYMNTGHGRTSAYPYTNSPAANKDCGACHNSTVPHKDASNPFRLHTSNADAFCKGCHGSSSEITANISWNAGGGSKTGYVSHSKLGLQAAGYGPDAAWNFGQPNDNKAKCVDCHDPHGDKNRAMIHTLVNYSGSNKYGQPNYGGSSYTPTGTQMIYTALGGQMNWSSYADNATKARICQRCHTPTAQDANMENFTKNNYNGAHKSHQKCTACHNHKESFAPAESSGGQSCKDCHADLFSPMNSQAKSYHHVMQNTSSYSTGNKGYPTGNVLATTNEVRRRCLMCHVDHDIFRSQSTAYGGRAANLRANINTVPGFRTGQRSDWSGTDSYGGICLSCHTIAQSKNTTKQYNDGSLYTLRLFTSFYRNTPHNYTTTGGIAKDGSRFKANCLKCHNDTMTKTKWANSTGFGVHDSKLRRINSQMGLSIYDGTVASATSTTLVVSGTPWTVDQWKDRVVTITSGTGATPPQTRLVGSNTNNTITLKTGTTWSTTPDATSTFTIGDPPEEDFCYNCHSLKSNPNGVAGKDYFGAVQYVNSKALKMEQTFQGDSGKATATETVSTLIASNKSWKVDYWKDYAIKITKGRNVGTEKIIASNSATMIYIKSPYWSQASNTTSVFAIGNPFRHRIDQFSGQHRADEAITAPGTATTTGWFADTGTGTHVGCPDCHNPHAQRKPGLAQGTSDKDTTTFTTTSTIRDSGLTGGTKNWQVNQWIGYNVVAVDRSQAGTERMIVENGTNRLRVSPPFSARMTGVYYNILARGNATNGNKLNGPANGQWGVKVTKWDKPTPSSTSYFNNLSAPTFSKITTLRSMSNTVDQLCFKCHSNYAWGTSGTPFRIMDAGLTTTYGTYTAGVSTDISKEFNPNNLAHHALFDIGKNQPLKANYNNILTNATGYYNSNWPKWNGTAGATISITTGGVATLSEAMPITVIPGWYVYVGADTPPAKTTGAANTGWFQILSIGTSRTSFTVTPSPSAAISGNTTFAISAGLGNTFVPPYGPWSVLNCADCHDTDAAADPSGPHGSGRNWLLRKMEPQMFSWFNGTNVIKVGWDVDGWTGPNGPNTLCLNCHRADVYGNDGNEPSATTTSGGSTALPSTTTNPGNWSQFSWRGHYSRQPHSPDPGDAYGEGGGTSDNVWQVVCMFCHGGRGHGYIHGTNVGIGTGKTGTVLTSASTRHYQGKRFLTGSAWVGVKRSGTAAGNCWVDGGAVADSINKCNDNLDAGTMRTAATYEYGANNDF